MQTITSTAFRQSQAKVFEQSEPVRVTRRNAENKIIISESEYLELKEAKFKEALGFVMHRHANTIKALADR